MQQSTSPVNHIMGCPHCGFGDNEQRFCGKHGYEFVDMYDDGSRFCPECHYEHEVKDAAQLSMLDKHDVNTNAEKWI